MKIFRLIFVSGVCLQTPFLIFSQTLPHFFHRLTPEQGLSQAINSFVYKDSRGFVWISSIDGLNRFDGRTVKVYRPSSSNPHALGGNNIQSRFYETADGDLWFCTYEAIHRYRRRTDDFEVFQLQNENGDTITEGYYIFHRDPAEKLWIRLNGKLYLFDTRTRERVIKGRLEGVRCFVDTTATGHIRGVYSCFFGSQKGIRYYRLDTDGATTAAESFFTSNSPAKLPALSITDIRIENDTLVWLCGSEGLTAFNPRQRTCRQYSPVVERKPDFWAICAISDSVLVVSSTADGLWFFNKRLRKFVRQITHDPGNPHSLASVRCEELNLDNDGNLWISHWNTGLSFVNLQKQKFENIQIVTALPALGSRSPHLSGLVEDKKGRIWCSTEGAGICLFTPDGVPAADFSRRRDLPFAYFTHLFKDRSNTIWAVERRHLYRYYDAANRFKEISTSVDMSELCYIYETRQGRLLVGTYNGVFEVKTSARGNRSIAPAAGFEFLKNNMVNWIYEDSNTTLYLGVKATTLLVIVRDRLLKFPFGYIKAAYETPDGRTIWLATTRGLVKMDKNNFTYKLYDESNGLPNQFLYSVIPDAAGFLWLASNKGILRFNPDSAITRQYGAADGVWENEFFTNAWLRTSSGNIWLGNRDVLNVFRPEAMRDVRAVPKIQITNLKVNDLDWKDSIYIGERTALDFPFSNNTLSFDFVALEYSDPSNNRLKYKMEGYDDQWIELPPGPYGFARYARLPPGVYPFYVMAANSDGVWNPLPWELKIRIRTPFWQTWWFILLIAMAVTGGGYSIYKYRLAQIRKAFEFRQKAAESEMRALRSQMNPHFIFNSINSINAFILRNESKKASAYLTEFAHLIRQILDNSPHDTISLENEIEFLQSYLRVEAMRLENKLAWDIQVVDKVDTFETEIPSMILQPYVENAVWHGIAHKPEGGKITVSVGRGDSGVLLLTVEDNGVGRARARLLQAAKGKSHESKGLKITEERLALYDQKHGTKSSVTTMDLLDQNSNAAGTRVEVRIAR
ncbi:MAG: hypothetical protein EPGJADBJ_04300 [Saprospiraceae bacterium]|nr:hypothetical protein [Saprospiraceae bacterium]